MPTEIEHIFSFVESDWRRDHKRKFSIVMRQMLRATRKLRAVLDAPLYREFGTEHYVHRLGYKGDREIWYRYSYWGDAEHDWVMGAKIKEFENYHSWLTV